MSRGAVWRRAGVTVLASALLAVPGPARAASAFAGLNGSWSGAGHIRLDDGRREAIRCRASYAPRGGAAMGLALRCASASYNIELRANLRSVGGRVTGSWEERSFGVSGGVSGVASGSNLRLLFSGDLSGAMLVTTNGGSQSISVRTDTSALKGVNVSLRRN